jgi:hypothetical protein
VATHPGRHVVESEQVLELGRVLDAPLHGVEQGELAVQQQLAAPGQIGEDRGDPAPEPLLFDGCLYRRSLRGTERPADLADLVVADPQRQGRTGHRLLVEILAGA